MPRSHGRGKTDEAEGASPAAGMWRSDLGIAPYARLRPDRILSLRRASPRCLRQQRGCFFALREAGFPAGLPFVFPCRIFGKFIRQMGD